MAWAMLMVDSTDAVKLALDTAAGKPITGQYLRSFDVDALGGRGFIDLCDDIAEAMTFATPAEVFETWRTQSTVCPLRDDGKPNCPLTAFSLQPVEVPS
jgi:hypothetical protein